MRSCIVRKMLTSSKIDDVITFFAAKLKRRKNMELKLHEDGENAHQFVEVKIDDFVVESF